MIINGIKMIFVMIMGSLCGLSLFNLKNSDNIEVIKTSFVIGFITIFLPLFLISKTNFFNYEGIVLMYLYSMIVVFSYYDFKRYLIRKKLL